MSTSDLAIGVRLGRGLVLTLAAGVLLAGASGCSLAGAGEHGGDPPTARGGALGAAEGGSPASSGDPAPASPASPADPAEPGDGAEGGGHDGGAARPAGPRIVYFRVRQQPRCPGGTNLYPVPGRPLVIEWKVAGASRVELAVDGPGAYGTYGAQGSEAFAFSCGGPAGTVEKHTYRLTPVGGGAAGHRTISAAATVNEIPVVDGPTAAPGQ